MSYRNQFARSHAHVAFSLAGGLLFGLALPDSLELISRVLLGWNLGVWAYLAQMGWLMTRADHEKIRSLAEREDPNAWAVLMLLSLAAALSLAAIVIELASANTMQKKVSGWHYGITLATVLGSWLLVGVIYALHYARLYYRSPPDKRALRFPDEETHPDYWDFLYFSFTISVAAQTSDISLMSRRMRQAALAQSVLSFVFNAAIVGMSINIVAGMVGH